MVKAGKKVYNLSVGTPDFKPAPHIMEAVSEAAKDPENYKYALTDRPFLLEAVQNFYKRRFGVSIEPEEIMTINGSQEGMAHIAWALCNPGDVVLTPNPGYPIFSIGPSLCGADVRTYPLYRENGFLPKLSDIPEETMNEIKIAQMGSSDDLVVGEQVVAIGNALGYGQSVTSGWVSALNRTISTEDGDTSGLIQTDAAINPGNSGGALLNMKGEVIGINAAKYADSQVEGMGYAIPISKAEPILEELMNRETRDKIEDTSKVGYMGIKAADLTTEAIQMYNMPAGAFLTEVTPGGAADKAGIKKGDIVVKLDGQKVSGKNDLVDKLQYYESGETVEVVIARANNGEYKEETVEVTLGSKPASDN